MRKYMRIALLLFCLLFVAAMLFAACAKEASPGANAAAMATGSAGAVSSGTKNSYSPVTEIEFTGIEKGSVKLGMDKIKSFPPVETDAESLTSDGEILKFKVKGVALDTILKGYGKKQSDYASIRATAADGYVVELPKEIIAAKDVILAYELNGKPLGEKEGPVRVIVDKERALYWAKLVCKIDLIETAQAAEVRRVVILESTYQSLAKEPYTYKETTSSAVKMEELFGKFAKGENAKTCTLIAADGLIKTQQKEIVEKFFLKVDGESAPMLTSPDVPIGMHFKELKVLKYGAVAFYSTGKSLDNSAALPLTDVLKAVGLHAEAYILAAADGYTEEVTAAEAAACFLKQSAEDGVVCFRQDKEDKAIKQFLSVTAK